MAKLINANVHTLCALSLFAVTMSASKSIIHDLNAGEKLNDANYDVWHRKIQYLLEDQNMLEPLTKQMEPVTDDKDVKYAEYQAFKVKDRAARITLLSSMGNDLLVRFEQYKSAKALWDVVTLQYGGTSTTRLRRLTMRFDSYKKVQSHSMRQHLNAMSNMISELRAAGHQLTDEQQVQSVIRSLPRSW